MDSPAGDESIIRVAGKRRKQPRVLSSSESSSGEAEEFASANASTASVTRTSSASSVDGDTDNSSAAFKSPTDSPNSTSAVLAVSDNDIDHTGSQTDDDREFIEASFEARSVSSVNRSPSLLFAVGESAETSFASGDHTLPETDDDEAEAETERQCLSPRTRQSIGRPTSPFTSDSDNDREDDDVKSEEDEAAPRTRQMSESDADDPDDDVKIVPKSTPLSSPMNVVTIVSSDDESPPKPKPKLVQQKITAFTPKKENVKLVSQNYFDEQMKQCIDLEQQQTNMKRILNTVTLPDNGTAIRRKMESNAAELTKIHAYIKTLRVEEKRVPVKNALADDWSKITDAINAIQPVHTGRIGLNTFNVQKTLTMDRLQQLHASMETCPAENMLADTPRGLKVELMEHQKYALSWMMWRERQRPRGGILADDMGLGKTLTMISLVVAMGEQEEATDEKSSSDDSDASNASDERSNRRKSLHHGGTLVVCPASLINQWQAEVEHRVRHSTLSVVVHHGPKREIQPRPLTRFDIVITTYAIVQVECKSRGALFGVRWKRIVLDEAHVIRNYKSLQSQACIKLKGSNRWSLTGTPIQNKEKDLFAQLKFLRCSPFDDLTVYMKWIGNQSEGAQQRMNKIVQPLLLRRTKVQLQERGALMGLPTKTMCVINVKLDKDEMNVYQRILIFSKSLFARFLHQRAERDNNGFLAAGTSNPNNRNLAFDRMHKRIQTLHGQEDIKSHQIFVFILRLRQICCHPGLIDAMLEDDNNDSEHSVSLPEIDLLEQLEKMDLNSDEKTEAEPCTTDPALARASSKLLLRTNPVFREERASSKFRAALDVLKERVLGGDDKAVVVSQWTGVLNLFREHLNIDGIRHCAINGQVPVKFRNDIVCDFNRAKSNTNVMLLSLTAGGVGLNLIGANHLLLLDPHWNPQLEAQAQDRIYRVGQTKPVTIYKFMCEETIEMRINALQNEKLSMARDVLAGVRHTVGSKLSIDDMRALFEM